MGQRGNRANGVADIVTFIFNPTFWKVVLVLVLGQLYAIWLFFYVIEILFRKYVLKTEGSPSKTTIPILYPISQLINSSK
jgi:hypothetical protein